MHQWCLCHVCGLLKANRRLSLAFSKGSPCSACMYPQQRSSYFAMLPACKLLLIISNALNCFKLPLCNHYHFSVYFPVSFTRRSKSVDSLVSI